MPLSNSTYAHNIDVIARYFSESSESSVKAFLRYFHRVEPSREMGKRRPSFEALDKLTDIFDRKLYYILGISDDTTSPKLTEEDIDRLAKWHAEEDLFEVIMKYLRLDQRGKAAVEALINSEFNFCRSAKILRPRENYLLRIRIRDES